MTFIWHKYTSDEDITDNVVTNSIIVSKRCDQAFAQGSCQAILTENQNIPPYSVCEIDSTKYLFRSEATLHQAMSSPTQHFYTHNISITELTAVLECFIVGTKVLSHDELDTAKIEKLTDLMAQKYGVSFTLDLSNLPTSKNEYRFGNGTTLFDALTQIMMRVNCRPLVTNYVYTSTLKNVTIGFIKLDGTQTTYTVQESKLIQWTKTQDQDNYCKYLETEANNVIDTTNLAYDRSLTERSLDSTRLTETVNGTGKIYTTNKINRINKLEVNTFTAPAMDSMWGADFFSRQGVLSGTTYTYPVELAGSYKTLKEWCEYSAPTGYTWNNCQLYTFFNSWCQVSGVNFEDLLECEFYLIDTGTSTFTKNGTAYTDHIFYLTCQPDIQARPIDVTASVLEKSQYDAEADVVRPKYCYYTQGSNVIDGLHVQVNQGIWDAIASFFTGTYRGPFMPDYVATNYLPPAMSETYSGTAWYTGNTVNVVGTLNMQQYPFSYNVEYEAITNPIMIDEKDYLPTNEANYKPFGRSYQVGANQVDYDKLVRSMEISNEMLGKVEHTIEIMLESGTTWPQLANEIKYGNTYLGYLLNYEIKYNVNYKSMVMYITSSIQNIANAIGIPYQYHATRNAIEGIVERPIRLEKTLTTAQYTELLANADKLMLFLAFRKNASTPATYKYIMTRATLMTKNDVTILYCEALDQYAFGYKIVSNVTAAVNEPVPYCDSNNEIYSMVYRIGWFIPTLEESRLMPEAIVTASELQKFAIAEDTETILYKDQYEKLTFTIKINKQEE